MAVPYSLVILFSAVVIAAQLAVILLFSKLVLAGFEAWGGFSELTEIGSTRLAGAVYILSNCGLVAISVAVACVELLWRLYDMHKGGKPSN